MAGIIVVANPNSRQNMTKPKLIQRLQDIAGDRASVLTTANLDELNAAAQKIFEKQPSAICINGGDGTNSYTLTALAKVYGEKPLPPVAFLRGGTMNTVATGLGISGSPLSILKAVLSKEAEGEPWNTQTIDTLQVDNKYGFLFGTGLMAGFLEAYYDGGNPSPWTAVKTLARVVGSAAVQGPLIKRISEKQPIEVISDGVSWGIDTYDIIGAGTTPSLAFFFRPFYRALEKPGSFHLWGVQCGPWELSKKLPKVALAQAPEHKDIRDQLSQSLILKAEKITYQLDGEIHYAEGQLSIRCGQTLQIIKP